jgi:ribosomal protein S12 methylthiotransferase accessory factor
VEGAAELTRWLRERRRRTWLFDITTALGVPVLAAASAEPDGREVALGFAARLEWHAAAVAALTEMAQMEHSLAMAALLGDGAGTWDEWRRRASLALPPLDAALRPSAGAVSAGKRAPPAQGFTTVLERSAAVGIDLWFVDLSRSVFGARAVRAATTALSHCKPRFARLPEGDAAAKQVPLLI